MKKIDSGLLQHFTAISDLVNTQNQELEDLKKQIRNLKERKDALQDENIRLDKTLSLFKVRNFSARYKSCDEYALSGLSPKIRHTSDNLDPKREIKDNFVDTSVITEQNQDFHSFPEISRCTLLNRSVFWYFDTSTDFIPYFNDFERRLFINLYTISEIQSFSGHDNYHLLEVNSLDAESFLIRGLFFHRNNRELRESLLNIIKSPEMLAELRKDICIRYGISCDTWKGYDFPEIYCVKAGIVLALIEKDKDTKFCYSQPRDYKELFEETSELIKLYIEKGANEHNVELFKKIEIIKNLQGFYKCSHQESGFYDPDEFYIKNKYQSFLPKRIKKTIKLVDRCSLGYSEYVFNGELKNIKKYQDDYKNSMKGVSADASKDSQSTSRSNSRSPSP